MTEGLASKKVRQPFPSKKAIPQPSRWSSVFPPRAEKPSKEKQMSVGTLQFIPSSWHMDVGTPHFRLMAVGSTYSRLTQPIWNECINLQKLIIQFCRRLAKTMECRKYSSLNFSPYSSQCQLPNSTF